MASPWFNDQNFSGFSNDFLDSIKFFDFPLEDVEENHVEEWDTQFQNLGPLPSDIFDGFSSGFCAENHIEAPKVQSANSVLKSLKKPLLSSLKSSSGRNIFCESKTSDGKYTRLLHTSSPVSVLENNNLSSAEQCLALDPNIVFTVKRARSKRLCSLSLNPRVAALFSCSSGTSQSISSSKPISETDDFSEAQLPENSVERMQKEEGLSILSDTGESMKKQSRKVVGMRKCMHCETTKTPQWREGPLGQKTLCNACGVRYRTGRLFPEYRPAASPTFVPSVHSNLHKKVIEMRKRAKRDATPDCNRSVA